MLFGRLLTALDQLANALAALAADVLVKFLAVAVRRGLAAAAADVGVVLGAVLLLGGAAALAADLAVEVAAVALLHRLSALTAGFGNGHLTGLFFPGFFFLWLVWHVSLILLDGCSGRRRSKLSSYTRLIACLQLTPTIVPPNPNQAHGRAPGS